MIPVPSLGAAFVAGLVTFLAPCTLPLVPAYLGFLSGTAGTAAATPRDRWRIVLVGFSLMLGFGLVFVVLGTLAGMVGAAAGPARLTIQRVGGIIVVLLGLSLLGLFRLPILQRSFQWRAPAGLCRLPVALRSFLYGIILGTGWTPCVGPILGTVLFLAATTATAAQGALLLAVYSVGLAIPFLLVAVFYSQAARAIARLGRATRVIEVVAGAFLVFLGVLFASDRMAAFIGWSYRLFGFVNYDALYRFF